jgi:hypothetical protein
VSSTGCSSTRCRCLFPRACSCAGRDAPVVGRSSVLRVEIRCLS